jgi:replication factor A1
VILLSVRILGHPNEKIGEPQDLYKIIDGAAAEPTSVATASGDPTDMDVQQQPQYHQPQFDNQRGAEDETRLRPLATIPIEDLNPYQNKWTIKARVTQKSDIKAWSNKTGEGKMFSVTLIDKSGEIKATAFNTVADEFFSRLEEGKVYCISKARIKLANKIYSTSDYELTLERDTNVEEVGILCSLRSH